MKGYAEALAIVNRLTESDRQIIAGIKESKLWGFNLHMGSTTKFSTVEGLDTQIAEFTNPIGMVYLWHWIEDDDKGAFVLKSHIVEKSDVE